MLKKLFLFAVFAVLISLLAIYFSWRLDFLNPPIRHALEKLTKESVLFDKIKYRPFNRITVDNLKVGQYFKCEKITVYLNPLKLVSNIRNLQSSVLSVNFEKPALILNRQITSSLSKKMEFQKSPVDNNIGISFESGQLDFEGISLNNINGGIKVEKNPSGKLSAEFMGQQLEMIFNTETENENIKGCLSAKLVGPDSQIEIALDGNKTGRNKMDAKINLPVAQWKQFNISSSSGSISVSESGFRSSLSGSFGEIDFSGTDFTRFILKAKLELGFILPSYLGQIELEMEGKDRSINGRLNASKLHANDIPLGDVDIYFSKNQNKVWLAKGTILPKVCLFSANLQNNDDLSVFFQAGKRGFGKISGKLRSKEFNVKFSNWPMKNFPVLSYLYPNLDGTTEFNGRMDASGSKFELYATNWQIEGADPLTYEAHLRRENSAWFFNARSRVKDWALLGKWKNPGDWYARLALNNFRLYDFSKLTNSNFPIKGNFSGSLEYSSSRIGNIKLKFTQFAYKAHLFEEGNLGINLTPDFAEIKNLFIRSGKGRLSCYGKSGLDSSSNNSMINLTLRNFPVNNKIADGVIQINGDLKKNKEWNFYGYLDSNKFRIDNWHTNKLYAVISANSHSIAIENFVFQPLVSGGLNINFDTKAISGKLSVNNFKIEEIVPQLHGLAQGSAVISGTIKNPAVVFNYSIPKTEYQSIVFSQTGDLVYKNNTLLIQKILLTFETGNIQLAGKLTPNLAVSGRINLIPCSLLKSVTGTKIPVDGFISGYMKAAGDYKNPEIILDVSGKNIYVDKRLLSEFAARLNFYKGNFRFEYLNAKFADSELKLLPMSSVDLNLHRFNLNTEWRNIHLGPADFFGMLKAKGTWEKTAQDKISISAALFTDNFWINQCNLEKARIDLRYDDEVVTFTPNKSQSLQLSGSIDLNNLEKVRFSSLTINWQNTKTLSMSGIMGKTFWNFSISGDNVSASALGELVDLQAPIEGDMNIDISGRGSVEQPQLEGTLNISNGMINDIPFDKFNLQWTARQDVITLIKGNLAKKDQYSIIASGFAPFFLTQAGNKRVKYNPIDLTFTVEEGDIGLLSNLIGDIESASGPIRAQAHISGILSKPVANGYIRISNGQISSKRYFSKMSNFNADCVWKNNILNIRGISGKIGNSKVVVKGTVGFDGLKPKKYNIVMQTEGRKGVSVSIPELPIPSPLIKSDDWELFSKLSYGQPSFALRFNGEFENPLLSGWIEIENTHFTYPSLAKRGESENILDELWPKLSWDVEIRAGQKTWYENELVSANVQGNVKLSGKGAAPTANGRIEAVRGNISYLGREFKIVRAVVEIVNDQVFIEANAETEVYGKTPSENDTVQLIIDKSEIGDIKPRFISRNNPNMPPEKALAIATGFDSELYSPSDRTYLMRQQLIRLFDSTLTTPLARNLLRRSGIADTFRVQYQSQEPLTPKNPASPTLTELLYGTKYSVEKYLTNRIFLGYSLTFDTLDQIQNKLDLRHELELSYRLRSNIFLRGIYEFQSSDSDRQYDRRITLEQQWRFGRPKKKQ